MISLLLTLALFVQGIPPLSSESGTITGTLKTETGMPAAGVRVGAMVRPEAATDLIVTSALASIAETDSAGHFRLENIPPGRYVITAGRVDYPTYFPGTQDLAGGRVVLVKAGDSISGIDFAMNAIATRPPDTGLFGQVGVVPTLSLSIKVAVADGSLPPIYSAAGFTTLRLAPTTGTFPMNMPLNSTSANIAFAILGASPDYRVTVENLPNGYSVKSIAYGTTDITNTGMLKINPGQQLSAAGRTTAGTTITITTAGTTTIASAVASALSAIGNANVPLTGSTLNILLARDSPSSPALAGVRVTGKTRNSEPRSVFISGVPGVLYSDGSFEFRGVPPGRHTISTPDNPSSARPQAASVVVGTQDVSGIDLVDTPVLPIDIQNPAPPAPAGTHVPGILPLAVVHGRVVDEATKEPISYGTVYITGRYGASYELDVDGRFEIPRLLPGSYALEVHPFAHSFVKQTIVVGEDDMTLNISTAELN